MSKNLLGYDYKGWIRCKSSITERAQAMNDERQANINFVIELYEIIIKSSIFQLITITSYISVTNRVTLLIQFIGRFKFACRSLTAKYGVIVKSTKI